MNTNYYKIYFLIYMVFILFFRCSGDPGEKRKTGVNESRIDKKEEIVKPLAFKDIQGAWALSYKNGYGYEFKFFRNFKSLIILYLKSSTIIFKGVYTIEDENIIKVSIFEMKNKTGISKKISKRGFIKTKNSFFYFKSRIKSMNNNKYLVIKPVRIIIDGNDSKGYFEPVIKLKNNKFS